MSLKIWEKQEKFEALSPSVKDPFDLGCMPDDFWVLGEKGGKAHTQPLQREEETSLRVQVCHKSMQNKGKVKRHELERCMGTSFRCWKLRLHPECDGELFSRGLAIGYSFEEGSDISGIPPVC